MTYYGAVAGFFALFYAALGVVCFWLSYRSAERALDVRGRPNELEPIRPRRWLQLAGGFFIILSLLAIPGVGVDALEHGEEPTCEWLLNSSFANATTDPINATSADYGEMFHYNAVGTTQTVGVANSWIEVRVFEAGNLNNVTFDTADDTLAPLNGDVFSVEWSLSFAGGVSDEYKIAPFVNNVTELTRCNQHRKLGTGGDVGSASGSCLWSFSANDTIGLKVQNIGDTNDIDVYGANVNINRLVGSLFEEGSETVTNTTFEYYNSCASLTAPEYIRAWFVIQSWMIWIAFFALLFGTLIYAIRFWGRML